MHNHVANRGRKALLKQIFSVFLIFTLYFNSFNSAYASTSLGGWTITSQIAQGASLALTATKTAIINGASVLKTSTAKITPNASQVAKILRGGAAGYALSIAVEQIIGSGIDWVLDPANNQILYKDNTALVPPAPDAFCATYSGQTVCSKSYTAAAQYYVDLYKTTINKDLAEGKKITTIVITQQSEPKPSYGKFVSTFTYVVSYQHTTPSTKQGSVSATVLPEENQEPKTLPLETVAQKVIDNAESSSDQDVKAGAQVATTAAAQDMLANDSATQSDVETQLNANAKTQTSEEATGNTKPNEANPEITDISLSFPAFCGWAPSVCEAANVVINFPTTLTNWWTTATTSISDAWTWTKARYEASVTSISDFFKNEPDQTDNTDLPVQEIPTPQLQTDAFSATPGCPEPIPIQIKIGVEGTAHISYEPICQFAEKWSFIAPLIGFLSGAMIIVGVGRKGEDSEI